MMLEEVVGLVQASILFAVWKVLWRSGKGFGWLEERRIDSGRASWTGFAVMTLMRELC